MAKARTEPGAANVTAPEARPEVFLMGPADPGDVTFRRTLDMMVEYGIHVESDGEDNLPAKLAADLSVYKAVVVDAALPAAEELKSRKYDPVRGRIVYYRKPAEFSWNDERAGYVLVHGLMMRQGVRPHNPAFLGRNASRRDRDVILGQAEACIEKEPYWIRVGNDVSHTWLESIWAATKHYRLAGLRRKVLAIIADMLDRDAAEKDPKERCKHPIYHNPCLMLPMWKQTGDRRFLEAALMKMPPLRKVRPLTRAWRRGAPYMRCETMAGYPWTLAMRAAWLDEPEFFQPAADAMAAGLDALFDRRKNLFAHYGVKGERLGLTWSRGQGWALYGLVGLLEFLPRDHPEYEYFRGWLDREADGLRRTQDPATGLWHNVAGEPSTRLEVSGTAMVTRHFSRAWRLGLTRLDFLPEMLARAWKGLKAHTFQHRTCTFAYGTGEGYDVQFYATVPCGGSYAYSFIGGAEYVATFGPLAP